MLKCLKLLVLQSREGALDSTTMHIILFPTNRQGTHSQSTNNYAHYYCYISRLRFDNVPLRPTHVGHGRQSNMKLVDRVQLLGEN